jgi:hypothetical protein
MGIQNGTNVGIYVGGTLLAYGKSAGFKASMSPRDTTTKDSVGNRELAEGLKSFSMDFKGLVNVAAGMNFQDLYAMLNGRTSATIKYGGALTGEYTYSATAYCTSIEQSGEVEGNVEFSATFEVSGAVTEAVVA